MASLRNVVLVDGARSAFARGAKGKLVATRLDEAGAKVLRALLDRNPKVKDTMIEDVGLGNVCGFGEFTLLGTVQRLAGPPARGVLLQLEPPVRLQHGDAPPHRDGDHGRRDRLRRRARHRAHGPRPRRRAAARRRRASRSSTRGSSR